LHRPDNVFSHTSIVFALTIKAVIPLKLPKMSKKRKREPEPAMLTLAGIYEKLADESEDQRLRAAHSLLKDFEPRSTSIEQIKIIITRLFRGLCSSRKAARLGYSVALTEYLIELNVQRGASIENGIPASSVIDILDNETTPEGNNSGQDERDHYFGRLFGAEAIIKSNILVKQQNLLQWKRLLDLICGIANKKPWLKQECGWILYGCVKTFVLSETSVPDDFALDVVEKLTAHKMIRTPEGLAIWLEVSQAFPDTKLPKDVWKHRDPLSKKDITLLADVLKDAKTRSNSDEDEHKSQGRAVWSAQLHFAWDVVLACLYNLSGYTLSGELDRSHPKKDHKTIDLSYFWTNAVEGELMDRWPCSIKR
jgi:DNA polymerase phi